MIDVAVVGLGKMGLSHLSMIKAHPDVNLVGVCDGTGTTGTGRLRACGAHPLNPCGRVLADNVTRRSRVRRYSRAGT